MKPSGAYRILIPLIAVMLQATIFPAVGSIGAEPVPSRDTGKDLVIVDITSHTNGSWVSLGPQSFRVHVMNDGTEAYAGPVVLNLSVWYPAIGAGQTMVFWNTTTLLAALSQPGSHANHTFAPWVPSGEGEYLISVEIESADDHPSDNSFSIRINVQGSIPYLFDIVNLDLSSQTMERGKSTYDPPYRPYRFRIWNRGLSADTYSIRVESRWLLGSPPASIGPVAPQNVSDQIVLHVAIPDDAPITDWDTLVINVTSLGDGNMSKESTVNTSVALLSGVSIVTTPAVQKVFPGGPWANFTFMVTNTGDLSDSFDIRVLSRPMKWEVRLWTGSSTGSLSKGRSFVVRAGIRIPELNYDTMMEDLSYRGAVGALVLQVESPTTFTQGSAEGLVDVGLVHTVQMRLDPGNHTVEWHREGYRDVRFNVSLRSVNNDAGLEPLPMRINLSTPFGPEGVLFTPAWMAEPNMTESSRWYAGFNKPSLDLAPGEWSKWVQLKVSYPPFPFQGMAVSTIKATPLMNETFDGLVISKLAPAIVNVEGKVDFEIDPPRWDLFGIDGPEPDSDRNGVPDWREGAPGDRIVLPFNITNTGNTMDSYLSRGYAIPLEGSVNLPDDWSISFPEGTRAGPLVPELFDPLSDGYSSIVWVETRVPERTPIGERVNITVLSRSQTVPSIERTASIEISVKQGFGLDLEPEESDIAAYPGESVDTRLNLTNLGNGNDIALLDYYESGLEGWTVDFNSTTVELGPGGSASFSIFVTPSSIASSDQVLSIKVRAESLRSPDTFDEVYVNVTVRYIGGVSIVALSSTEVWKMPGEIAAFNLRIINTGNGNDTFEIGVLNRTDSWVYSIRSNDGRSGATYSIPRGGSISFWINMTLPELDEAVGIDDLERLRIVAMEKVVSTIEVRPVRTAGVSERVQLSVGILQEFRSGISLVSGESSIKEALPGEDTVFRFYVQNRGNGLDTIRARLDGDPRYVGWSTLNRTGAQLRPFDGAELFLGVNPEPTDVPLYGEEMALSILALAGNNLSYRRIDIFVNIVMSRIVTGSIDVDLGTVASYRVRICNMPDPGEVPVFGFPLQKTYTIWTSLFAEGDMSSEWSVVDNRTEVVMTNAYDIRELSIRVKAPGDLLTGSPYARIKCDIDGGPGKTMSHSILARGVYFDCYIDIQNTRFENLYEGGKGRSRIQLIATGNRPQDSVPVMVLLDGVEIGRYTVGPTDPSTYLSSSEALVLEIEFDLPVLRWYEKGRELDLRIVVDPDDELIENTPSGRGQSETNNVMEKEFTIKNYMPHPAYLFALAGLFLLLIAFGLLGYLFHHRRNSLYMVPLAAGLSGIIALVFYLPFERSGDLALSNTLGAAVVLIDLLLILPLMVYLFTRAGNAYIMHVIKTRSSIGADIDTETLKSPMIPFAISLVGGLLLVGIPLTIWVLPSTLRDKGVAGLATMFIDGTGPLPVWAILVLGVLLSVALQGSLLLLKRLSMRVVLGVSDKLERLNQEIKEGLQ